MILAWERWQEEEDEQGWAEGRGEGAHGPTGELDSVALHPEVEKGAEAQAGGECWNGITGRQDSIVRGGSMDEGGRVWISGGSG